MLKKKIISIAVLLGVCAGILTGCGAKTQTIKTQNGSQTQETSESGKKLSVVTTIYAPYDFTRAIVGNNAEVTMLLAPGAESHSYEPTPQDIIKIQNCNVFIYAGGENDTWVDKILSSVPNDNRKVIKMLDCVDAVEEELKEGMQPEEEETSDSKDSKGEEEETEWDEHVWTSPKNAIRISNKIEEACASEDQKNGKVYEKNLKTYTAQLEKLDQAFRDVISKAKRKTVIFGDRFPLRYFVEEYGLDYYAAFPGCSGDTEASAETMAFLIDKVKEEKIPVVFQIELSNGALAKTISEATGAKILTFNACHNVSKDDFLAKVTYLDLMWKNVDVLKEALN